MADLRNSVHNFVNLSNICAHKICEKVKNMSFSFCIKCGVMIIIKEGLQVPGIKPKERRFKQEVDCSESVKMLRIYNKIDQVEEVKTSYLAVRRKVISLLKELFKKHKFSESTLYLALEYLARILGPIEQVNVISEAKLELLVIGSFLLAGKK